MADRTARRLLDILAAERKALRGGAIGEALALGPAKENALANLHGPLTEAEGHALRAAAAHNCRLLKAALSGWEEATGRRNALSAQAERFQHYRPDGRQQPAPAPRGAGLEKRA